LPNPIALTLAPDLAALEAGLACGGVALLELDPPAALLRVRARARARAWVRVGAGVGVGARVGRL